MQAPMIAPEVIACIAEGSDSNVAELSRVAVHIRSDLVRAERLNAHWFLSSDDVRVKGEAWRRDYNEHRPHSPLGNQTPLERAFSSGHACLT